jgi:hypothetical protein
MSRLFDIDPLKIADILWPDITFYRQQEEIIYAVDETPETYVTAGNKLGKDFVAAFVCLSFFLRAIKEGRTCKIVTTSASEKHLNVLWSEIGGFVARAKYPLLHHRGGPLLFNSKRIVHYQEKDIPPDSQKSYLVGLVTETNTRGEGLSGHHAEVNLGVIDEASSSPDIVYAMFQGWAKRMLIFGNPNPCDNFFRRNVEAGDLVA